MMQPKEIKIGDRLYHAIFGWCVITHPVANEKVMVDLEADEIKYYKMGQGYITSNRDKNGRHILLTPITDLFPSEEIPDIKKLKRAASNPQLKFYSNV